MSKRGTILLAVGILALGLVLGFVGGGVASRFAGARSFGAGRFAPRSFYGAPRMGPGMMPPGTRGGMYRGAPRGHGMPFGIRGSQSRRAAMPITGARVTQVESNSGADKGGLKTGDVITAVAGTNIDATHSFQSLLQARKPGDKIDLNVNRAGQTMTISVTLGTSPQNSNIAYLGIRYQPTFQRYQ